jgi:hypothetical protein
MGLMELDSPEIEKLIGKDSRKPALRSRTGIRFLVNQLIFFP